MKDLTCEVSRWKQLKQQLDNLPPAVFATAVQQQPGIVIDVRTPAEYAAGHLSGARNLDYFAYTFWEEMEKLDRSETYYVYCRSARRSVRACTLMRNGGFEKVYHLEGGLVQWREEIGELI